MGALGAFQAEETKYVMPHVKQGYMLCFGNSELGLTET